MRPTRALAPMVVLAAALALAVALLAAVSPAAAKSSKALDVKPTLVDPATASATVGPEGGTLTATAKKVTYTLAIPAGAIPEPTAITMTPIAKIGKWPFKRPPVGGVQLAPEGLALYKAAELTIKAPKKVRSALRTPFAYLGSGKDFHLYPDLIRSKRKLVLLLTHFSAAGMGQASGQERQIFVKQSTPDDRWARTEQELAKQAKKDLNNNEAFARAFLPAFQQVEAGLRSVISGNDWDAVLAAVRRAVKLDGMLTALGYGDSFTWTPPPTRNKQREKALKTGQKLIQKEFWLAIENSYATAKRRCVDKHDPTQGAIIFAIARTAQLLGRDLPGLEDARKCQQFTVKLSMQVSDEKQLHAGACWDAAEYLDAEALVPVGPNVTQPAEMINGLGVANVTSDIITIWDLSGTCPADQYSFLRSEPVGGADAQVAMSWDPNFKKDKNGNTIYKKAGPPRLTAFEVAPAGYQSQSGYSDWPHGRFTWWDDSGAAHDYNSLLYANAWRLGHSSNYQGTYAIPGFPQARWYAVSPADWAPGVGEVLWATSWGRSTPYLSETTCVAPGSYCSLGAGPWEGVSGVITENALLEIRHTPQL